MEIRLSLTLPRDSLTEAVTNVLDHAETTDVYEVSAGVHGTTCIIEVIDHGGGFDSSMQGLADAAVGAEGGRGVQIMRALVDRVDFISHPQDGTVVHLEKELRCADRSTLDRLGLPAPLHGARPREDDRKDRAEPA